MVENSHPEMQNFSNHFPLPVHVSHVASGQNVARNNAGNGFQVVQKVLNQAFNQNPYYPVGNPLNYNQIPSHPFAPSPLVPANFGDEFQLNQEQLSALCSLVSDSSTMHGLSDFFSPSNPVETEFSTSVVDGGLRTEGTPGSVFYDRILAPGELRKQMEKRREALRVRFSSNTASLNLLKSAQSKFFDLVDKVENLSKSLTKEQIDIMKNDLDASLQEMKIRNETSDVPCLIWNVLVVYHANQAWADLTGFSEKLPTEPTNSGIPHFKFVEHDRNMIQMIRNNMWNPDVTQFMGPTSIRVWRNNRGLVTRFINKEGKMEEFLRGTCCITIKRDIMGFPILLNGQFLPSPDSFGMMEDDEDEGK
eukprot:TRINITY_DN1028_c0_g1_i2.p1 TRINITY_DN1028_c0_g1~~TRINITY_DN1028_c0_g1_i2.p1  ORF type:complete len:363 (+),score=86.68 TRINITY_DN1028_c0_g1_i2:552-1640(+)